MKRGFTLIELLAVILVLAIVALIAVPTFIGVVNKVKIQTLKSSAYGLIEAGTLYNAQYANKNNARFDITNNIITTTEENKIKYKGSIKQGTVIVSSKGKVSVCVTDGKNSAYKNYDDTEVTLKSDKTCTVPANTSVVYLDGEATIDIKDAKAILDRLDALEESLANSKQGAVKSIQRGTFTISASGTWTGSKVISINTVNPDKCLVLLNSAISAYSQHPEFDQTGASLHSLTSDSLTIYYGSNYYNASEISWQVIEFY